MYALRRAAVTSTDFACRAVGRGNVVRAARFVLWRARLDVPNDLRSNGELLLQRWMLDVSPSDGKLHILDVGANIGQWSDSMIATARRAGRLADLDLHAFEPSSYTFARLSEALEGQRVSLLRAALSDRTGSSTLHVLAPGAGTNSLHQPPNVPADGATEEVPITTLDAYVSRAGLTYVTLVKIDTEGNDLAVLRGARTLLSQQRISAVQFEYNHRWIYARYYLRDAFNLLAPLGYRIGKLTPRGVEFYPRWEADLESFVEGNYVACTGQVAEQLPSVAWWKSASRGVSR